MRQDDYQPLDHDSGHPLNEFVIVSQAVREFIPALLEEIGFNFAPDLTIGRGHRDVVGPTQSPEQAMDIVEGELEAEQKGSGLFLDMNI